MKILACSYLLYMLLATLFWSGCTTNKCAKVDCGTHGQCVDGACICDVGYDNDTDGKCTVEERAMFFGVWRVRQNCANLTSIGDSVLVEAATTDIAHIKISNAWSVFNNSATAVVANNLFSIPLQEPDNNNYTLQGSGRMLGDTIYISFIIEHLDSIGTPITSDTCSNILWTR